MKDAFTNTVVTNRLHHRIRAKRYRGFFTSVSTLGEELPPDCKGKLADGSCSNQLIPNFIANKEEATSDRVVRGRDKKAQRSSLIPS